MAEWNAVAKGFGSALGRPAFSLGETRRQGKRAAPRGWRALLLNARARLVERISGGAVPADAVREAMAGGTLFGQWGTSGDEDFRGYRTQVGAAGQSLRRELDWQTYNEVVSRSLYAYGANPIGGWIVDKTVELCVGDELTYTLELKPDLLPEDQRGDAEVKALTADIRAHLDRFWTHRAHNFQTRGREYATTRLVTGNLLMPATFLDAVEGRSLLGVPTLDLVDAQQIASVKSAERSAIVAGEVIYRAMEYGGTGSAAMSGTEKALKIIRENATGELEGEAFFFPWKSLLNSLMGYPYLMRVLDWLDRLDDFMFKTLDRGGLLNSLIWHVMMEGLTREQCKAEGDRLTKEGFGQAPHTVVVTNDKGNVTAVHPKFEAGEIDTFARTLRTHILGTYSFPEAWYSSGGDVNRAVAADQTDVTYKSIESVQGQFRTMYEMPLHFAYDAGRRAQGDGLRRNWPARSTGAVVIRVNLPPIRERDYQRSGAALGAIVGAISEAEEAEALSHETGQKIVWLAASKLGHDISPDDERRKIEAERADREAKDIERQNERARLAAERALGDQPDDEPAPADETPAAAPAE